MRMRHSIMVSDETWKDYGGSPSAMRETLIRHAAEQKGSEAAQMEIEVASSPFELIYDSICRIGGERIAAGTSARYAQVNGHKALVCSDHFNEAYSK